MSANSKIEWTDASWNPVTGCSPISEGCQNCYAARTAKRLRGRYGYPTDDPFRVTFHPDRLEEPMKWRKSRRVFVCSMGDLFHDDIQAEWVDRIYHVMQRCNQHTFILLTKRPENIRHLLYDWHTDPPGCGFLSKHGHLPNVWLGVTAENQEQADKRIPILLDIPAAVHWVSVEPMLGPVDLTPYLHRYYHGGVPGLERGDRLLPPSVTGQSTLLQYAEKLCPNGPQKADKVYLTTDKEAAATFAFVYPFGHTYRAIPERPVEHDPDCTEVGLSYQAPSATVMPPGTSALNWVVCGGESGPGARPMHPEWARSLRAQCQSAGVPFFFKQWGEWGPVRDFAAPCSRVVLGQPFCTMYQQGKKHNGRELDGRVWDQMPEAHGQEEAAGNAL